MASQEIQQKFNDNCRKGNHQLIDILSAPHRWDQSLAVARWCEICGSVAVDIDFDGRTNSGQIMKMVRPKILES